MDSSDDLQFDHAEYSEQTPASTLACSGCQKPITEGYFQINGEVACADCRDAAARAAAGGSGIMRLFGATAGGLVAGIIGASIYFAIAELTGYEIGLVAIVVGLLVGGAVRWGASGRGGWVYQLLAMFLTYCAIVATYIPSYERYLQADVAVAQAAQSQGESAPDGASMAADIIGLSPAARYAILFVIVFVETPLSLPDNLIGILIIGFALFEAWKINKRTLLSITGPYQVHNTGTGETIEDTSQVG